MYTLAKVRSNIVTFKESPDARTNASGDSSRLKEQEISGFQTTHKYCHWWRNRYSSNAREALW